MSWTVALRSWATGTGGWTVDDENPPSGFGGAAGRGDDQPRGTWPGSVAGVMVAGSTVGTVGVLGDAADAAGAVTMAATLRAAWQAASTSDVGLTVTRGTQARTYYGRPDGCTIREELLPLGFVAALCSFRVLDPFGYGPVVAATGVSSPLVVSGDVATERVVWTIHGNGGTPSIVNSTTAESLLFASVVASGQTRVVDVRARTVVDGGGVSAMGQLSTATAWPRLAPGSNTLAISGCASVDVSYLPAYP